MMWCALGTCDCEEGSMLLRRSKTCVFAFGAALLGAPEVMAQSAMDAAVIAMVDRSDTAVAATASAIAADGRDYRVIDMPIGAFFTMLQADSGQRIAATPDVAGYIRNTRLTGSVDAIVGQVAAKHDLEIFAYDGVLHVSRAVDDVTQLVPLEGLPSDRAARALRDSGLSLDGDRVKTVADGNALLISGPPDFIAIAKAILVVTPAVAETYPVRSAIRVRRGTETAIEHYGAAGLLDANQVVRPADPPKPEDTAEEASDG
jgi:hypothetical protein